jgi:ribosomal protein S13
LELHTALQRRLLLRNIAGVKWVWAPNLMKKTSLKIRHLVQMMVEEEISFHEKTVQNLTIETDLEGIESAKRNCNDTTSRQNPLREIEVKKPALMVYERRKSRRSVL